MAEVAEMADAGVDELDELDDELDWLEDDETEGVEDFDAVEDDEDEEVDAVELFEDDEDDEDEEVDAVELFEDDEDEGEGEVEVEVETVLSEDDALIDDDESGWLADPDVAGQERYWDGAEWTDQVRAVEEEPDRRRRLHLPDHVPELQRALAAATADIDDVEARLSTLFERGGGKRGRRATESAGARAASAAGPPIHEEFGGAFSTQAGGDPIPTGGEGAGLLSGDDDETFAELDAALAAEEPDKPERRIFRRRS